MKLQDLNTRHALKHIYFNNLQRSLLILGILSISGCTTMHSNDPDSLAFSIPKGSTMSLNNAIDIPHRQTHVTIQRGKAIKDEERDFYNVNCRIDFKAFGPRTIQPETFIVKREENGQNWISQPSILRFYSEIYLASEKDTDVIKMVCQTYGGTTDRNFTVAEMQQALGDYITFNFKLPEKADTSMDKK